MACRGVHFAITDKQYRKLTSFTTDDELIEFLQEEIEEGWDEDWLCETDKAWDAIHRCLTDGKLEWNNGSFPLNAVVIGGKQLHRGEDYIISLITSEQVVQVAGAIKEIDEAFFRKGYQKIKQSEYDGLLGEEDFQYTWEYFKGLPALFEKAAKDRRSIIFSVDQ